MTPEGLANVTSWPRVLRVDAAAVVVVVVVVVCFCRC